MSLISGSAETDRVVSVVELSLVAMGYEIILVRLLGHPARTLQITIDRTDGQTVTIDDCTRVSRSVSALLDVDDVVGGPYSLEVSSPGINRPLTRPKDFERYQGKVARIEVDPAVDGRRRFCGNLRGMTGAVVQIAIEEDEFSIPFGQIEKAKLILTDELLAAQPALES